MQVINSYFILLSGMRYFLVDLLHNLKQIFF